MLVSTWAGHMSVQQADWKYKFFQYTNLLFQTTFLKIMTHAFYTVRIKQVLLFLKYIVVFSFAQVELAEDRRNKVNGGKVTIKKN